MIELLTAPTPNGWKASIMLEEVGLPYEVKAIDLGELEQKQDWFLKVNPNGRIPAIIDHGEGDFGVFESGAILVYLAEKTGKMLPTDPKGRSLAMQWLMFQMGGVGPMQGQSNVFTRYAPVQIPFAIERYQNETRRLYEVMDLRLGEAEYLAGDYGIADISTWPWVSIHGWAGVEVDGLDHLQRWLEAVGSRPAVQKGRAVPTPPEAQPDVEKIKEAGSKMLTR